MKFTVTAEKNVMVNGKIVTFKAGEVTVTDDDTCKALMGCKGVKQVEQVKAAKKK